MADERAETMAVTHFADDETIAELERQARRIAELEAALAAIHATSRRVTHHHEWYLDGVRQSPGVYVVMRVGDAPDAPVRRQPLRVIVCGGRDFADSEHVWRVLGDLDDEYGISAVAHGGAAGADSEAGKWATAMRKSVQVYHARWKQEGKAAGPLRNQRMLDQFKPDAVVAFPGGRGTADMVWRAVESGVRVVKACTSSDLPAEDAEAKAQRIRGAVMTRNEIIARRLMEIAAAHSVNATLGWASHTCVTLSEAARLLRGEPEPKQDDDNTIGVLSEHI